MKHPQKRAPPQTLYQKRYKVESRLSDLWVKMAANYAFKQLRSLNLPSRSYKKA